jgi:uncharacterized protein (TIGR02246 family)
MDTNFNTTASHLSEEEIAANELAVRALYQNLIEAWGDADSYAALFTEDGDYITFDGSHARGRAEIAEAHRPLFEGILKGSRLFDVGIPLEVRFLSPDVALIHSGGAVLRVRQKKPSRRAISVQTMVATKQEDRWLFAAFQNTRYRPFAQTFLGKILTSRAVREAQPTKKHVTNN